MSYDYFLNFNNLRFTQKKLFIIANNHEYIDFL